MRTAIRRLGVAIAMIAGSIFSGCATMSPVDLSQVRFSLERVSDVHVAGIDISGMRSAEELNPFQLARATLAFSRQRLPLEMTLHLKSENPFANRVAARLVSMEWTLMLDGRETISGSMDRPVRIPAGEVQEIPIRLHLNMFDYFDEKSAMDLLDLALAFAGEGGGIPHGVALKVRPVIDTPLGAIRYGTPLLIEPAGK
jgi:hypothetical protein